MGRVTRLAVKEGDRVKPASSSCRSIRSTPRPRCARRGRRWPARTGARAVARRAAERARQPRAGSRQNAQAPAGAVAAGLTTRESLERAQAEVEMRESDLKPRASRRSRPARRSSISRRPAWRQPAHAGAGPLRSAVRRHRHAPQHRRRRERRRRHDEQRRHRAADRRRHVDDRGRGRSRRDRHPVRAAGTAGPKIRSTRSRQDVLRHGHRDRQQPDQPPARDGAHRDELQGDDHHRRPDSRGPARVHLHRGDHHGDAPAGRLGADPGDDGARAALRRTGQRRPRAASAAAAVPLRRPTPATAAAPPSSSRDRSARKSKACS